MSYLFSIISLRAFAGLLIISPAAIRFTTTGSNLWMTDGSKFPDPSIFTQVNHQFEIGFPYLFLIAPIYLSFDSCEERGRYCIKIASVKNMCQTYNQNKNCKIKSVTSYWIVLCVYIHSKSTKSFMNKHLLIVVVVM